jgi:hypothetical protein
VVATHVSAWGWAKKHGSFDTVAALPGGFETVRAIRFGIEPFIELGANLGSLSGSRVDSPCSCRAILKSAPVTLLQSRISPRNPWTYGAKILSSRYLDIDLTVDLKSEGKKIAAIARATGALPAHDRLRDWWAR